MKKIVKELIPYVIIVVVVFFIRTFIITPVRVYGSSMENTVKNNDILFLKKFDKIRKLDNLIETYWKDETME